MSCSLPKDTASMSLEMVLSCIELGLFRSESIPTGKRGAIEEGAEEEAVETDGAVVNAVLLDSDSCLSDLIWQFVRGETKEFSSVPVEIMFDLLTLLSFEMKLA